MFHDMLIFRIRMIMKMRNVFLVCILFSCSNQNEQELSLPSLFSDGMVLQRDTNAYLWGKGVPGKSVSIYSSWGKEGNSVADLQGNWEILIPTTKTPGPHSLLITDRSDSIKISDILFGEVWVAAGQSNMEMDFNYCCNSTDNAEIELANANHPMIRMFNVNKHLSFEPTRHIEGSWKKAVGDNINTFSSVAYFFAKRLKKELDSPIGIIHSSWGGSRLEAWTSEKVLGMVGQYENELNKLSQIKEESRIVNDWYSKFQAITMPSGGFDLFLGDYLRTVAPEVDYLSYFFDKWKELDNVGSEFILADGGKMDWDSRGFPTPFDKENNFSKFKGVVLFRNDFDLENINDGIKIQIEPEKEMPWGLWEYDIYVNGVRIGSSLINIEKDRYAFTKTNKVFDIDPSILIKGENRLILRSIGYASFGDIQIRYPSGDEIRFGKTWRSKVIAEEFFQIGDYKYPYTSLYFFKDQEIDFSQTPKKTVANHHTMGMLFNGMLYPLIPYSIAGMIWYQGETNIESGGPEFDRYASLFPLMIKDLRERWNTEIPFYFAQVAPYFNYNGMSPYFRDLQRKFLRLNNTGMVVTLDIGENHDIHPSNKHDVGYRFARLALNDYYGKTIVSSGPLFKSAIWKNGKVRVEFDSKGSGLVIRKLNRSEFELAGDDMKFKKAKVINHINFLEVSSSDIDEPRYLRYAFSDTSSAILFNMEGLPASTFFTPINKFLSSDVN